MTKAVAEGLPKHRIEEAAAARAAKVDTGETVIVGVNRYRLAEEEEHDILEVDNAKVRAGRSRKIEKVRAARDETKVRAALDALERRKSSPPRRAWAKRRCPIANAAAPPSAASTAHLPQGEERTCWPSPSKPPAPAPRSAKSPTRSSARSAATAPCPSRCAGIYGKARARRPLEGRRSRARNRSPTASAASPGSWSPRWARTATTAAPTSSRRPSPTSASK